MQISLSVPLTVPPLIKSASQSYLNILGRPAIKKISCIACVASEPEPRNEIQVETVYVVQEEEPLAETNTQNAFKVPWGWTKIAQVFMLWLLAYLAVGQVGLPLGMLMLQLDRATLSARGVALQHLALDVAQLASTIIILWSSTRKYRPRAKGLFPLSWRMNWVALIAVAALAFPVVDWLSQLSMDLLSSDPVWLNPLDQAIPRGDWITISTYAVVVSLCAPIWEELIFRGFLLCSLTRYLNAPAAVAVSSLAFALCHFQPPTFIPLLLLGALFSVLLLRTRNLLPPILMHSAWNLYVLGGLIVRGGLS